MALAGRASRTPPNGPRLVVRSPFAASTVAAWRRKGYGIFWRFDTARVVTNASPAAAASSMRRSP